MGMIINALTSLLPVTFQPGNAVNRTSPNPFSAAQTQTPADSPSISPAASFLSMLQQVQQQNPTLFKQITSRLATQFQNQANAAAAQGNSTQASQLKQLATEFQNSSTTGQLPSAQALQVSGFGTQHGGHHGHHHGFGNPPQINNDPTSLLNSILGSSANPAT
ncbi:MAG TPA: hypothetical protein VK335_33225 [Bryobacteraceae bacterium]|nr:hypothetical protein [Bryobacteraceae bacterium]